MIQHRVDMRNALDWFGEVPPKYEVLRKRESCLAAVHRSTFQSDRKLIDSGDPHWSEIVSQNFGSPGFLIQACMKIIAKRAMNRIVSCRRPRSDPPVPLPENRS